MLIMFHKAVLKLIHFMAITYIPSLQAINSLRMWQSSNNTNKSKLHTQARARARAHARTPTHTHTHTHTQRNLLPIAR